MKALITRLSRFGPIPAPGAPPDPELTAVAEETLERMTYLEGLLDKVLAAVPQILAGLLIFLLFWLVSVIVQRLIRGLSRFRSANHDVELLIEQSAKVTLLIVGGITALGTMGANVSGLVASLGLVGFGVGYALKDAISNTLAGVLLRVYRPFQRGDSIAVSGNTGQVREINLRYTVLDTPEAVILVPNAQLFTNVVKVEKVGGANE